MTTDSQTYIRFNLGERFDSVERIDEVFSKGSHRDLMALFTLLMIDPFGAVAERVGQLCDSRLDQRDDENLDDDLLKAARHLLLGFSNMTVHLSLDEYTRPEAPVPDCPRCSSPLILVRELPVGCEIRCFGAHCDWRDIWPSCAQWQANCSAPTMC